MRSSEWRGFHCGGSVSIHKVINLQTVLLVNFQREKSLQLKLQLSRVLSLESHKNEQGETFTGTLHWKKTFKGTLSSSNELMKVSLGGF